MFPILIRRELLANLTTFRFLVAMVVTLSLVVVNTVVLIADYERRLTSYNIAVKEHHQKFLIFLLNYLSTPINSEFQLAELYFFYWA